MMSRKRYISDDNGNSVEISEDFYLKHCAPRSRAHTVATLDRLETEKAVGRQQRDALDRAVSKQHNGVIDLLDKATLRAESAEKGRDELRHTIRLWAANLLSDHLTTLEACIVFSVLEAIGDTVEPGMSLEDDGNISREGKAKWKVVEAELKAVRASNIAERLGGDVRGEVRATGGYLGALALVEEIEQRFKSPKGGGRATDPEWTEQRLIRLKAGTRERLERFAKHLSAQGQRVAPMQLAALLLERASEDFKQLIDESVAAIDDGKEG